MIEGDKELARLCAKGSRQLMFVEELLQGVTNARMEQMYPSWVRQKVWTYGRCRLDIKSYGNLRDRLVREGFVLHFKLNDKYNEMAQIAMERK